MKDRDVQGTQALDRALEVLRIVSDSNRTGIRLADIMRRADLTRPTVHRLAKSLEAHGFIERDEATERYFLGAEIFALGTAASIRFDLKHLVARSLARLAQETEDTVFLSIRHGWSSLVVAREAGAFPIRTEVTRTGDRQPLGISAGGMAMLALLPEDEMEESLERNAGDIEERFPNYSADLIRNKVAEARTRGFASNEGLVFPGSWGVAVALQDGVGNCVGAITVAAIQQRFEPKRQAMVASLIQREARAVRSALAVRAPADSTRSAAEKNVSTQT